MAFGKYGVDPVDQARALRLALAVVDDAMWAFQQVIAEVAEDVRGDAMAHLLVALAEALAYDLSLHVGPEAARDAITFRLIQYEEEEK